MSVRQRSPSAPFHDRTICAAGLYPGPLFVLTGRCPRGRDRRSANVTANLPNHSFAVTSGCTRDGHKNADANARFLPDLTIFRMNTCTKRVGGCRILAATSTLFGFGCRTLRFQGCGFSTAQPRLGVQLHPQRDCATVRLKVPVTTSREAAVPCAHI